MNKMDIGSRLKQLRKSKGLTAAQLADKVNITREHLSSVENNIKTISLSTLQKICDTLDISMTDFFAEEDELGPEFRELLNNAKHLSPEQLKKLNDFLKSLITDDINEKRQ